MQGINERNYHSFFLIAKGASKEYNNLGISESTLSNFNYLYGNLNSGQVLNVANKNDLLEYKEMCNAFESININKIQQKVRFCVPKIFFELKYHKMPLTNQKDQNQK